MAISRRTVLAGALALLVSGSGSAQKPAPTTNTVAPESWSNNFNNLMAGSVSYFNGAQIVTSNGAPVLRTTAMINTPNGRFFHAIVDAGLQPGANGVGVTYDGNYTRVQIHPVTTGNDQTQRYSWNEVKTLEVMISSVESGRFFAVMSSVDPADPLSRDGYMAQWLGQPFAPITSVCPRTNLEVIPANCRVAVQPGYPREDFDRAVRFAVGLTTNSFGTVAQGQPNLLAQFAAAQRPNWGEQVTAVRVARTRQIATALGLDN